MAAAIRAGHVLECTSRTRCRPCALVTQAYSRPVACLPTCDPQPSPKCLASAASASPILPQRKLRCSRRVECLAAVSGGNTALKEEVSGKDFAVGLASVLDETKCQDIVVLDVAPLVSWTSYMIFCTVFSKPQLLAALARVEKAAVEQFQRDRMNTPGSSPWECLDYGDVVLHIMTPEQREYYDIENFYAAAQEVELPFSQEAAGTEEQPPQWARKEGF